MPSPDIGVFAASLVDSARVNRHRIPVVVSGEPTWCYVVAGQMLAAAALSDVLWLGKHAPVGITAQPLGRARRELGSEYDALVFDTHSGFSADLLAAATGTVRGGGLCLLLTAPLATWSTQPPPHQDHLLVYPYKESHVGARFFARLATALATDADVVRVEQDRPLPTWTRPSLPLSEHAARGVSAPCLTNDQAQAVAAIIKVARGHRHRPLVLISDRGRGKSAALGIAAAQLLEAGSMYVVVTGPNRDAVEPVFAQITQLTPQAAVHGNEMRHGSARVAFQAPDVVAQSEHRADLLLVDEAAALPVALLRTLLQQQARIVFATTVHGYEGSGRGFELRFQQVLSALQPQWRRLQLETPIRWANGDPTERLAFDALLLNAAPVGAEAIGQARLDECCAERLDRDILAADEQQLRELFGLMVLAHYRTRPDDLQYLLDGSNVTVHVVRHGHHIVAAALVAQEGGFDARLSAAIYAGTRRPRGHLLPQSLCFHAGLANAAQASIARIVRIAVHPNVQRRGFGSKLLAHIIEQAHHDGCDAVGASFGAEAGLLRFWTTQAFAPVRIGLTREHTSGTHAVMLLHALTGCGRALQEQALARLARNLPVMLTDSLRDLDAELAAALLSQLPAVPSAELDDQMRADICSFAFGQRGLEVNLAAVQVLADLALRDGNPAQTLNARQQALLVMRVLQRRDWITVARALQYTGRAQALDDLRATVRALAQYYGYHTDDEH